MSSNNKHLSSSSSSSRRLISVAALSAAAPIKLTNINEHLQCGICNGYITDATTITDCLHSFCKPCIFHYFGTIDHHCPTCNTSVKDVNESIRSDSRLQRLIYNMVPGLLQEELAKREKYFENASDIELAEKAFTRQTWVNLKLYSEQIKAAPSRASSHDGLYVKYIQCLAETPVRIIAKLIRNKFAVPSNYKIKLTHEGQLLKEEENFLEVFTSFIVDKDEIFDIKYDIKKTKHRRSLKNIENKLPQFKTDVVTSSANTSASNDNTLSTNSPSKSHRHRENTTTLPVSNNSSSLRTKTSIGPLSADIGVGSRKHDQLPSPTSSSSSSSSARLKNSNFLKVKFRSSAATTTKRKSTGVVTSTSSKKAHVIKPKQPNRQTTKPQAKSIEQVMNDEPDRNMELETTTENKNEAKESQRIDEQMETSNNKEEINSRQTIIATPTTEITEEEKSSPCRVEEIQANENSTKEQQIETGEVDVEMQHEGKENELCDQTKEVVDEIVNRVEDSVENTTVFNYKPI